MSDWSAPGRIGTASHRGPVGRGLEGKLLNNLTSIAHHGRSAAILDGGDKLGATGSHRTFHDALEKHLDHPRELPAHDEPCRAALLAAAEHMLARHPRAAADHG